MTTRNDVKTNLLKHIRTVDCRPDNINYPNGADPITTLPYMDVAFLTTVTAIRHLDGSGQKEMLFQIDLYDDLESGTDRLYEYAEALTEALRNRNLNKTYTTEEEGEIDLRGITAFDIPDENELGSDGSKYRLTLSVPIRYSVE